jgi:cytochrome c-type biogenesis protein CcmF
LVPELGHLALIVALMVALVQSVLPLVGAARRLPGLMAMAVPGALVQFVLIAFAFGCLTWAHVTSDFTVVNVVENSHTLKPLLYKVSGVWGNHEGSMLLWVLMLTLFGGGVALLGGSMPMALRARTLAVQAMITLGFLAFIIATSNPFERIFPPPVNGHDLNPLLQDPGLAVHPPLLYFGYVGFSIVFSFAMAALIEGRVDPAWARWVRPWTLAAWTGLTAGITLGSNWAYYELGWGGFWFWDPVENASFMPWLVGTALLHSAIVVEKRGALKSWTILLAIITFSLSLMGTFLVRSGVLSSVHAFAVDPGRGYFILALMVIAVGGSLALYAWRAPALAPGGLFQPISREGALVLNNLLLATAAATVLIGTLYPLVLDVVAGERVTVGSPYYNATFVPLMVPLLALLVVGPLLGWKRSDLGAAFSRLKIALLATAFVTIATLALRWNGPVLGLVGIAAGSWVLLGSLAELADRLHLGRAGLAEVRRRAARQTRASWGMVLAHAGLGIAILGMVGTSLWVDEHIAAIKPGSHIQMAGYDITYKGAEPAEGPNYTAEAARFEVSRGGQPVAVLKPERRFYPVARMETTEAAILTRPFGDLYIATGAGPTPDTITARVWHHPLVPWLWGGGALMVLGGLISLSDRRYRLGAPARRLRPAMAAAVPAAE